MVFKLLGRHHLKYIAAYRTMSAGSAFFLCRGLAIDLGPSPSSATPTAAHERLAAICRHKLQAQAREHPRPSAPQQGRTAQILGPEQVALRGSEQAHPLLRNPHEELLPRRRVGAHRGAAPIGNGSRGRMK